MSKRAYLIILLVLAVSCIWFYITTLHEHLSLEAITTCRTFFLEYTHLHPYLSRLLYTVFYFITVAAFLPAGAVLNLLGGFLFGTVEGLILANSAASAGAVLNLLMLRYFLGNRVQKRYSARLQHFNDSFTRNGTHYLLSIRLLSIFPFSIVNTLAALTNVSVWNYLWTTSVGIIPGQAVFIYMGRQLGTITSLNQILTGPVIGAFMLLALIVVLPTLLNKTARKLSF